MKPIAILSNKTRAEQRPPLQVIRVDAALLASLGFKRSHPVQKPARSVKRSKPAVSPSQPANPSPAAQKPPVLPSQGTLQKPSTQQAVAKPSFDHQSPAAKMPLAGRSPQAGQKPKTEQQSRKDSSPQSASQQEAARAQAPGQPERIDPRYPRKQFSVKPPQPQNHAPIRPADRLPGVKPPAQNIPGGAPVKKDPPARETPPASRDLSQPPLPASLEKRGENNPLDLKPTGLNGNGSVLPAKNGQNGTHKNGIDSPSFKQPRVPGENGTNGAAPRNSLFRPGAFASMPVLRIPPKVDGSIQRPPTQIPMEVYSRPDSERNAPTKSEMPPAAPVPPRPQPSKTPGLDQLYKQNANLPVQAAVLGVCEDGLPVLLDLADPGPGALVVIGDEREAQLEFLRSAITSVVGRNSPRSVQFIVFSCEPDAWQTWAKENGFDRHLLAVENAEAETVRDWIVRLADWTEQRRMGQSSGPAVLLIMDTLSFLPALDYDIRLNFDWMAKEGPPAQIWPLAVISTDLAKSLSGRRMLRAFQTRVMGYANHPEDYVSLAGLDPQAAVEFGHHGDFKVRTGELWLRFRLPGR